MELDKIYNIDCIEWMRGLETDSVDAIITSPPYNFCLRVRGDNYTRRSKNEEFGHTGRPVNKYTNGLTDDLSMEQYFDWQCQCLDEMLRLTKGIVFYNIQLITGNKVAVFKILGKYAEQIREVLIWDKITSEPAMHFGCLNSEYELIIAFDKSDCKGRQFKTANFERGTLSNVIRIGKNRGGDTVRRFLSPCRRLLSTILPTKATLSPTRLWGVEQRLLQPLRKNVILLAAN